MAKTLNQANVLKVLKGRGALLVFPIKNKKKPESIWSVFFPRSQMKWEWDESGDGRVVRLWHLRAELAESQRLVYSKWYQGRATVFAKDILPALLRLMNDSHDQFDLENLTALSPRAVEMLRVLNENSPQSTKELKEVLNLKGSSHSAEYERTLKELFARFLIVGVGEIEDGAFPSLAIASTKLFFDSEWETAHRLSFQQAYELVEEAIGDNSPFFTQILRYQKKYLYRETASEGLKNSEISWNEL